MVATAEFRTPEYTLEKRHGANISFLDSNETLWEHKITSYFYNGVYIYIDLEKLGCVIPCAHTHFVFDLLIGIVVHRYIDL